MNWWLLLPSNRPVRSDPQVLLSVHSLVRGNPVLSLWFPYYPSLEPTTPQLTHWEFEEIEHLNKGTSWDSGSWCWCPFCIGIEGKCGTLKNYFRSWPVRRGKGGLPLYQNFYFSAGSVKVVGYIVTGSGNFPSTHHLFSLNIGTIVFLRCIQKICMSKFCVLSLTIYEPVLSVLIPPISL